MSAGTVRPVKIGLIGGSGLNNPKLIENSRLETVQTVFGEPSSVLVHGTIQGVPCVFLSRHGRSHEVMPTNVNFRANIWALKEAGCTHVLAATACGSLREEYRPGDLAVLDQFIDRTTKRLVTFHDGKVGSPPGICHLPMGEPFCPPTRHLIIDVIRDQLKWKVSSGASRGNDVDFVVHPEGCMVTIEGPRFSTKAESKMFRKWGADLINMTTVPEVGLAKEAGLSYASIAIVTDYDCWKPHEDHSPVHLDMVMSNMKKGGERVLELFKAVVPAIAAKDWTKTIVDNEELVKGNTLIL